MLLDGPSGISREGSTRQIRLGKRARSSVPSLIRYMREARPALALAKPGYLIPGSLVAGRITGTAVVPWEGAFIREEVAIGPGGLIKRLPLLQRLTYRWAPIVATVSSDVGEALSTRFPYPIKTFLLPNGIDLDEVRQQADGPEAPERGFRFCAAGRLAPIKGFDVLIEATRLARSEIDDFEVVIAGSGPAEADLRARVHRASLESVVRLPGWVDSPYALMRGSDAFVHPARLEPFGTVLLEAMALGLPMIAADCPGAPSEIIQAGRSGILVPPDDPETLAAEMVRLHRDDDLRRRLSRSAEARIESSYTHIHMAERMLALLEAVSGQGGTISGE